jgi:hypothetical protein
MGVRGVILPLTGIAEEDDGRNGGIEAEAQIKISAWKLVKLINDKNGACFE